VPPTAPRFKVTLDSITSELLRRVTRPGEASGFVRAAVAEKVARDESRGEVDELREQVQALTLAVDALRERLARVERKTGIRG
jgi:ubiquinone biosynthesis protein UbiJ